jgi:hypothetical protein
MDRDELLRVLRAFEAAGLEYVLIGATAMGLHGVVRATEDVDLFVRATTENIERLRSALRAAYDGDPHVDEIRSDDLLGDYPAVRYYPPSGDLYFDVMTRLGEAASFDTVESEVKDVVGIPVWVATPAALYRLKKGTVRPLDRQDAEALAALRLQGHRLAMAVEKFRSIEEMNAAPVPDRAGDGFERFVRHCARYWKLAPRLYPRGVLKFRNIEDAQAARARVSLPADRRS